MVSLNFKRLAWRLVFLSSDAGLYPCKGEKMYLDISLQDDIFSRAQFEVVVLVM